MTNPINIFCGNVFREKQESYTVEYFFIFNKTYLLAFHENEVTNVFIETDY